MASSSLQSSHLSTYHSTPAVDTRPCENTLTASNVSCSASLVLMQHSCPSTITLNAAMLPDGQAHMLPDQGTLWKLRQLCATLLRNTRIHIIFVASLGTLPHSTSQSTSLHISDCFRGRQNSLLMSHFQVCLGSLSEAPETTCCSVHDISWVQEDYN